MSNSQRFSQFTNNPGNKTGQQAQQQTPSKRQTVQTGFPSSSRSDSDSISDVSMSNENLSNEERFVLRHTSRVEPQGQENHLAGNLTPVNEIQPPSRFSSNTSTDSTRYVTNSNRSISENRTPVFSGISPYSNPTASESNRSSIIVHTANNSNRNSIKETNSNRSSMDTSYNTLIIHNDEGIYALNREYSSPPPYLKKDRPRSYGEQQQMGGMQEITEIPEEYLNQSHVLKHLAKEVKIPNRQLPNSTRDSGLSENTDSRDHLSRPYNWMIVDDLSQNTKMKSKSQPDLTRLMVGEMDIDIEALIKENSVLRQQLQNCYSRVAKSQKLEHEVAKIYRDHEDLVNSSERRERLERAARNRLQSDCRRLQELNRALRDQVEVLQQQLLTQPNDQNGRSAQHDALISQLVTQNKELVDANKRQYIEIQAQSATLEEQRIHINVLDTALKRLEEECRQKQLYVAQLQHALQSLQCSERREQVDRKLRYDYDSEISKDSNRSGSGETNNLKWQLREKDNKIMRLENECATLQQRNLEESRNVAKITMEKNTQETERVMAEAKQEKLRYLDETHSANRKVTELQTRLKVVENRLNEKDAMIRALQVYGSSNYGGSYNLSSDSFALGYNNSTNGGGGQASFDVSSNSYDNSLLDAHGSVQSTSDFSPSSSIATAYATSNYGQTNPTFNQSAINLHVNHVNYSPNSSSNYSSNYGAPNTSYTQTGNLVDDPIFDAQRKSIGDQLKQLDEQLLNKVSELNLVKQQISRTTSTLQGEHGSFGFTKGQSALEIDKNASSKQQIKLQDPKLASSCKDMTKTDKEVFY